MGDISKCKGKEKVPKTKPIVGKRNAQKDEKGVGYMEPNVMASYTEDASFVARGKLSGLRLEGSLKDYVNEFTTIVGNIQEIGEREKLNAFSKSITTRSSPRTSMEWS